MRSTTPVSATSTCPCYRTACGRPSRTSATYPVRPRSRPTEPMVMDGWDVLERARELSQRGEVFALATVVWRRGPSSGKQGNRAVVTASGQVQGWIGGACAEPVVVREARHALAEGVPRLMFLGPPDELDAASRDGVTSVPIACQSEGALEVYIEPVEPRPHVAIVGRSPMTEALTQMATAIGWHTVLLDPDGGSSEDHPHADRVVSELDFEAAGVNERSIVVVATQGHHDEDAVERALGVGPAYIGLVGSRQRGASVLGYLRDRGLPEETLERVTVPAGLDLGKTSHREIAVAILAELVKLGAERKLTAGVATEVPDVEEAVDPVCGMAVEVRSARHKAEYDGTTYFFCCPGCRTAFEKDAAAFVDSASEVVT
ncbi:MAG: YHS domain-containing protein [Pseudonocardiaceae bacterium]|nr:YHS domain-containing protein [Pseudonocardiaceae bacterium]